MPFLLFWLLKQKKVQEMTVLSTSLLSITTPQAHFSSAGNFVFSDYVDSDCWFSFCKLYLIGINIQEMKRKFLFLIFFLIVC
jgi:hypothetical protein